MMRRESRPAGQRANGPIRPSFVPPTPIQELRDLTRARKQLVQERIVAVAASILATLYHLLRDGTVYQDLRIGHFDALHRDRAAKSLVRRLQALGFEVDVRTPV